MGNAESRSSKEPAVAREGLNEEENPQLNANAKIMEMDRKIRRRVRGTGVTYNMKLVIRGDRGVGKTSLYKRLQGQPIPETHIRTPCISTAKIHWHGGSPAIDDRIQVEIWDVVDEASSSNVELETEDMVLGPDASSVDVYRNCHGVLLLFNIHQRQTLEYVKHMLTRIPRDVPTVVIGTFRDCAREVFKQDLAFLWTVTPRPVEVQYFEMSLVNCYGLKILYQYFKVPFYLLKVQTQKLLLKETERRLLESKYELQEHIGKTQKYGEYLDFVTSTEADIKTGRSRVKKKKSSSSTKVVREKHMKDHRSLNDPSLPNKLKDPQELMDDIILEKQLGGLKLSNAAPKCDSNLELQPKQDETQDLGVTEAFSMVDNIGPIPSQIMTKATNASTLTLEDFAVLTMSLDDNFYDSDDDEKKEHDMSSRDVPSDHYDSRDHNSRVDQDVILDRMDINLHQQKKSSIPRKTGFLYSDDEEEEEEVTVKEDVVPMEKVESEELGPEESIDREMPEETQEEVKMKELESEEEKPTRELQEENHPSIENEMEHENEIGNEMEHENEMENENEMDHDIEMEDRNEEPMSRVVHHRETEVEVEIEPSEMGQKESQDESRENQPLSEELRACPVEDALTSGETFIPSNSTTTMDDFFGQSSSSSENEVEELKPIPMVTPVTRPAVNSSSSTGIELSPDIRAAIELAQEHASTMDVARINRPTVAPSSTNTDPLVRSRRSTQRVSKRKPKKKNHTTHP